MNAVPAHRCDLLVVGTGMAGMAAALFAALRGIETAHVGMTGSINFASGLLDLMGVQPTDEGRVRTDPWAAIAESVRENPGHPYARLERPEIEIAFAEVTDFLAGAGVAYRGHPDRNVRVLTAAGTAKPTYRVPETMWAGAEALAKKPPCLLVDFDGLKGYSARQIAENLAPDWPGLRTARVAFPGGRGERLPEPMARALDSREGRAALIEAASVHLRGETHVGFPAVLGLERSAEAVAHLSEALGAAAFEIPTMPPAIPGLRIRHAFETRLSRMGVRPFYQKTVRAVNAGPDGFVFDIGRRETEVRVAARGAVLATGRFFGKGLSADREGIRETVFDLPVRQPDRRNQWHRVDFLDLRGHGINRAGLETDRFFRPLDRTGKPAFPRLFAAGSILANQDWARMKCGSGLAVATAYRAVASWGTIG